MIISTVPSGIRKIISNARVDIEVIHWGLAEQTRDGYSVPVYTSDIDGDGPHSGNMTIENNPLDHWVGDWEPVA